MLKSEVLVNHLKMESEIAADALLDYVTFQILPENRSDFPPSLLMLIVCLVVLKLLHMLNWVCLISVFHFSICFLGL